MIKVACHIHSEWSYDGKWPLRKLVTEFGRRGYAALLMTEHDRGFTQDRLLEYRHACAQASSDEVLLVPGIEYSDAQNVVHILVWGDVPFLGEGQPTQNVLNAVKAANGVAVLAHPSRRDAWKLYKDDWRNGLSGIELWNRKSDGWAPGARAMALLRRTCLQPFVGLDFHTQRQFFPLASELELDAPTSESSVLNFLAHGHCSNAAFGLPLGSNGLGGWKATAFNTAEHCRRSLAVARRRFATCRS